MVDTSAKALFRWICVDIEANIGLRVSEWNLNIGLEFGAHKAIISHLIND